MTRTNDSTTRGLPRALTAGGRRRPAGNERVRPAPGVTGVTRVAGHVITELIVAVPARNERDTIAACVASIDAAAAHAGVRTHLVIAADSCDDSTARIAADVAVRHCTVSVIEGTWGGAGPARRAAVAHALAASTAAAHAPWRVWIANTDADTVVPRNWLSTQLRYAATHHAVAGIVELDPRLVSAEVLDVFRATYLVDGNTHAHVHGANLGVGARTYLAAGGWCPLTSVGEDHGLWARLIALGATILHCTDLGVVTSGRTLSRVDGGFATHLHALSRERSTPGGGQGPREDADGEPDELVA